MHFKALCAFGYKYIGEKSVVEDFTQDAFLSFWERKEHFEHLDAVKSFLYTSVRNNCLNYLKHQDVERKHKENLICELEADHYYKNHVIREETFNQLYQEIKSLPHSMQQVMLLALNGLKNPEIAEELDISVNTVKSQKKNAYAKLKGKLSPLLQGVYLALP